jgi:hypothetical protein
MKYLTMLLLSGCIGRVPFDYIQQEAAKLDSCKKINARFKELMPNFNELKTLHELVGSMGKPDWVINLDPDDAAREQLAEYGIDVSFLNEEGTEYHFFKILYTTWCYHYVFLVKDDKVLSNTNLVKDPNGEQVWKNPGTN